jgi:hypothetical protein
MVHAGKPVTEDAMLDAAASLSTSRPAVRKGLAYARSQLEIGRIIRPLGNGLWIKT